VASSRCSRSARALIAAAAAGCWTRPVRSRALDRADLFKILGKINARNKSHLVVEQNAQLAAGARPDQARYSNPAERKVRATPRTANKKISVNSLGY